MDCGVATRTASSVTALYLLDSQNFSKVAFGQPQKRKNPASQKASPGHGVTGLSSLAVLFTRPQAGQIGAFSV
jgi:hypothetical protein